MTRSGGTRGQSTVLAGMFVFAFVVLAIGGYQTLVVPNQNSGVEFSAYEDVRTDMAGVRDDLYAVGTKGGQSGRTVKTGVTYPARALTLNPGPTSGSVGTTPPATVTLANVSAVGETGDYWTGDIDRTYDTRRVVFRPSYNYITAQPVVSTAELGYTRTENGAIPRAEQTLVRGNRISLVTVAGDLSTSGGTVSVTTTPISVSSRTVAVTADASSDPDGDGSPEFVITLPTDLSASTWQQILSAQLDTSGGNVDAVLPGTGNTVDILMVGESGGQTVTYDLRLARVEVSGSQGTSSTADTDPTYLTRVTENNTNVHQDQTASFTAEVRDEFNNPKAGVDVTFETTDGTFSNGKDTVTATSDEDGRVHATFAPDVTGTAVATARGDFDGSGTNESDETVRFGLNVQDITDPKVNPNESVGVSKSKVTKLDGTKGVTVEFKNFGDSSVTMSRARFVHGYGPTAGEVSGYLQINGEDDDRLYRRGDWDNINQLIEVKAGESNTESVDLFFFSDGSRDSFTQSEWLILEVEWSNGDRVRYFVSAD